MVNKLPVAEDWRSRDGRALKINPPCNMLSAVYAPASALVKSVVAASAGATVPIVSLTMVVRFPVGIVEIRTQYVAPRD